MIYGSFKTHDRYVKNPERTAELCDDNYDSPSDSDEESIPSLIAGDSVPSFITAFFSLFLARAFADFDILRLGGACNLVDCAE